MNSNINVASFTGTYTIVSNSSRKSFNALEKSIQKSMPDSVKGISYFSNQGSKITLSCPKEQEGLLKKSLSPIKRLFNSITEIKYDPEIYNGTKKTQPTQVLNTESRGLNFLT